MTAATPRDKKTRPYNGKQLQGSLFKYCPWCDHLLPANEDVFYAKPSAKDGWQPHCIECTKLYELTHKPRHDERLKARMLADWARTKYSNFRSGARQRNIQFDLVKQEFMAWHAKQEQSCEYCKITFEQLARLNISKSLDRANNKVGYTLANIVLACWICNCAKSDYFSYAEMIIIGQSIRAVQLKRLRELDEQSQSVQGTLCVRSTSLPEASDASASGEQSIWRTSLPSSEGGSAFPDVWRYLDDMEPEYADC